MSQKDNDNQEGGKVLPFEKPKKHPGFKSVPLDELKKRMETKGPFKPLSKQEWKKKVSEQQNKGQTPTGDLHANVQELREVCRILNQNLASLYDQTEHKLVQMQKHQDDLEEQILHMAQALKVLTEHVRDTCKPTS